MKRQNAKSPVVPVRRLAHGEGLPLPAYQSDGAAGLDLLAAVPEAKPVRLKRGERALVPTGLMLELPSGTEAQVRPRSGLALRDGLTVLNSPGTIDSDYRGEVQVILVNLGTKTVTVRRGDRIAQLVVAPVLRARLEVVVSLAGSKRGDGGFGSTGVAVRVARKSGKVAKPVASAKKSKNVAVASSLRKAVARRKGRRAGGRR